jgi:hypothetical protein
MAVRAPSDEAAFVPMAEPHGRSTSCAARGTIDGTAATTSATGEVVGCTGEALVAVQSARGDGPSILHPVSSCDVGESIGA